MAAISDELKWENSESHDQETEAEEESLSLCDLPVELIQAEEEAKNQESEAIQEDFKFGSFDDSLSTKSEMCSADDIFFKGQILPFRLSVSSENSTISFKNNKFSVAATSLSRSESLDRNSTGEFTSSFSSRSSSSNSRSQFSSSSSNSRISKPRITQNQFNSHPSPKPQIKQLVNQTNTRNRKSTTTAWDFFRLGLVRTPEIELKDFKNRSSVSRNSSSGSSSNNSNSNNSSIKIIDNESGKKLPKPKPKTKQNLLSGCNCTVSAVKSVPLNVKNIKNSGKNDEQEVKIKQQKKQTMSRHRTFEWIKELSSHASFLDHEQSHA
ncbi:probable membrane-associated kinase regulator 1 [Mercurialis annua]|uniref:probable membrane-associated kinase regulator 1 n=1 Tax=Mercurialis annua TaxID=3986 RepID=UPI00215DE040|nr:probable membrane-associated kinase regulator 1 [Mercurialis annua]